jgi:hypothetical protein
LPLDAVPPHRHDLCDGEQDLPVLDRSVNGSSSNGISKTSLAPSKVLVTKTPGEFEKWKNYEFEMS